MSGIINKYKSIPKPVKASLWFMVMLIFQKGIMFLAPPIYTRLLTVSEYGYYSVYGSWSSILIVFATLNLYNGAFNKGMLIYENDRDKYISSMQGLSSLSTIISFLVCIIFKDIFIKASGLHISVFVLMFLSFYFNPAFSYWSGYQRFQYEYRWLCIYTMLTVVLGPGLSIALIYVLPNREYAVILGNVIVQIAIGIIFYIRNLYKGHTLFVWEYWKFALKMNIPLIPHYLSTIILGQADRIMIDQYCGKDKAGIYSLAYSISLMLNVVVSAINSSFIPWTYKKIKEKKHDEIAKISNYILIIIGVFCVAGVLIAPEIIGFLGTEEYAEAVWIIMPVMLSIFFTMIYSIFGNIEFYYEKSLSIMFASVVVAILNIILNAFFIPIYGYMAAGYTTLVCYIAYAVIHYFVMRGICRKNNIKRIYNIKFIIVLSILLMCVCGLAMMTYSATYIRYLLILIIVTMIFIFRNKIIDIVKKIRK